MKIFHCDHCDQLVFFENSRCVSCGYTLAFLPDAADMGTLEEKGAGLWRRITPHGSTGPDYRLCENYRLHETCNWALPATDANPLCPSCRLTRVIPDLSDPANKARWFRIEVAKRRLVANLMALGLPVVSRREDPARGLAFELIAGAAHDGGPPVLTGHADGVITINIAEADDSERERRRVALCEPYRTLLGHVRHESGHYYWQRLVEHGSRHDAFRERFGDESRDYGEALRQHHARGAPGDWQDHFVSTYASSHPWEDWAESWAHYLHMADTLDTAAACGLRLEPRRRDEPTLDRVTVPGTTRGRFDGMIDDWFALTYVLNNLNRGLGQPDGYPFVLAPPVVAKLRFIHDTVAAAARRPAGDA